MPRTLIAVPCHNEEHRFNSAAFRDFVRHDPDIGFVLVNDGSTDNTGRLLSDLHQSDPTAFRLLSLPRNMGKAEAVRRGLLHAFDSKAEYVGFWDADLATPLSAIPSLRRILDEKPGVEIVIGSRVQLLGRAIERYWLRHYLGRVFATFASLLLDLKVYDTQCGAKLFRASDELRRLFQDPFVTKWIFDVEILARLICSRRGARRPQAQDVIYEVPLPEWRDVEASKVRWQDFIRAPLELFRIRRKYFS